MNKEESRRLIRQYQLDFCAKTVEREDKAYLEEIGFDPDECEEHHLPGDCPLCGGK